MFFGGAAIGGAWSSCIKNNLILERCECIRFVDICDVRDVDHLKPLQGFILQQTCPENETHPDKNDVLDVFNIVIAAFF